MNRPHFVSAALAALLGIAGVAVAGGDGPSLDGLEAHWKARMAALHIPGMSVAVVKDDRTLLTVGLGRRDAAGAKPVTPDTMFYVASCTKPYVAFLVQQLADEGKLSLDDPVKKHLPRFRLADPKATETITVRDLLCHRPGLQSFPIVFLDAFTGDVTEDRYYSFLSRVKPAGEVGYSNIHFTLAGRVAEAVGGKSWRDLLKERLFDRAGMKRTTGYASRMYADPDVAIPLAREGDGWKPVPSKTDRTMHAAGGLGTSARDLATWMRIHLNDGVLDGKRILSAERVQEMRKLQSTNRRSSTNLPDFRPDGFGLAWTLGRYHGADVALHGGGYTGASAFVFLVPEEHLGVAVAANADGAAQPACQFVVADVVHRLLGFDDHGMWPKLEVRAKELEGVAPMPLALEPSGLALPPTAYAGTFESAEWGTIRMAAKDGRVSMAIGDLAVGLRSTGPNRFEFAMDPETWRRAEFAVDGTTVPAVIIHWNDAGDARFDRVAR